MSHLCFALSILLVLAASFQQPAGRKAGTALVLQASYGGIKADLIATADLMPEDGYGLRPGSMPDARTFAQVIGHAAESHYSVCASMKGVPNPMDGRRFEHELSTKEEVLEALRQSFAYCDNVFKAATDANVLEFVRQGPNELPRVSVLYGLLAHDAHMYGNATVYLRLKGIVPPSTERLNKGRGLR
jgi:uncharacterized damage-inducible protein DinB